MMCAKVYVARHGFCGAAGLCALDCFLSSLSVRCLSLILFLWLLVCAVIKGTQLVQRSQLPQQRERKLQARFSAFLGGPDAGAVMHAVSVTSWLTDADDDLEAQTSIYGDDDRSLHEGKVRKLGSLERGGRRGGGRRIKSLLHTDYNYYREG